MVRVILYLVLRISNENAIDSAYCHVCLSSHRVYYRLMLLFLVFKSVGSFQPIVFCKQTIPHAGTILWGYKIVLTLAVILTFLSFILWIAFVGYTLSNGELVLFIIIKSIV